VKSIKPEVRSMKALLIPAAAVALLAGCVGYGDPVGYGYGYPGSYGGPVISSGYPGTVGGVYGPQTVYQQYPYGTYGAYPNAHPNVYAYPNNGVVRNRDRDGDGIRNRVDRDRDGDGVPNVNDARPNNPLVR
jgi:hypothetical protein